jgi:hypothetical protein
VVNLEYESNLLTCTGNVVVIVVAVVSSVIVVMVAVTFGAYIWKQRYIQKKRRGIRFNSLSVFVDNNSKPRISHHLYHHRFSSPYNTTTLRNFTDPNGHSGCQDQMIPKS